MLFPNVAKSLSNALGEEGGYTERIDLQFMYLFIFV